MKRQFSDIEDLNESRDEESSSKLRKIEDPLQSNKCIKEQSLPDENPSGDNGLCVNCNNKNNVKSEGTYSTRKFAYICMDECICTDAWEWNGKSMDLYNHLTTEHKNSKLNEISKEDFLSKIKSLEMKLKNEIKERNTIKTKYNNLENQLNLQNNKIEELENKFNTLSENQNCVQFYGNIPLTVANESPFLQANNRSYGGVNLITDNSLHYNSAIFHLHNNYNVLNLITTITPPYVIFKSSKPIYKLDNLYITYNIEDISNANKNNIQYINLALGNVLDPFGAWCKVCTVVKKARNYNVTHNCEEYITLDGSKSEIDTEIQNNKKTIKFKLGTKNESNFGPYKFIRLGFYNMFPLSKTYNNFSIRNIQLWKEVKFSGNIKFDGLLLNINE